MRGAWCAALHFECPYGAPIILTVVESWLVTKNPYPNLPERGRMKTDRTRNLPQFFTQVIGSLPRPKVLLDLLSRRAEISADRFAKLMDEMVIFAIRLQEQAGIDVISDGEWRRRHYVGEFLARVGGFERVRKFEHQGETKLTDVVVRRMNAPEPVFRSDAEFLVGNT